MSSFRHINSCEEKRLEDPVQESSQIKFPGTGKYLLLILQYLLLKGAATDMSYFARSKFSMILVHRKNFSLIRQVVFKLGYVFCQER